MIEPSVVQFFDLVLLFLCFDDVFLAFSKFLFEELDPVVELVYVLLEFLWIVGQFTLYSCIYLYALS